MILYFLRHGKTGEHRAGDPDDGDRELTDAGVAELRAPAPLRRRLNLRPDVVISWPLPHALGAPQLPAQDVGLRRVIGTGMLAAMVSCSSSPGIPSESVTPSSAAPSTVVGCPDLNLRTPTGDRIDLSGTWISGSQRMYYVYQSGSCVWWTGGFATSETSQQLSYGGLGQFTFVFAGELATDFTVSGTWTLVRDAQAPTSRYWGTITYQVDLTDPSGFVLQRSGDFAPERYAIPPDATLTRISDQALPAPP